MTDAERIERLRSEIAELDKEEEQSYASTTKKYIGTSTDVAEYILSVNKFRNEIPEENRPSWIQMTTITMLSKFNCELDLDKIEKVFRRIRKIRIRVKGSNFEGYEWRRKYTTFYNQITLVYQDQYSNKNIKLFPNGSIHVTGCASPVDCDKILSQLSLIVKLILNIQDATYTPPNIVMINTNFSLNQSINLYKLIEKVEDDDRFEWDYNPAQYSALKLKFKPMPEMKRVASNVFSSGEIIITGARTLKEIAYAYKVINEKIDAAVRVAKSAKPKARDMFMGGKFEDWVEILQGKYGTY
jgi:TATA-box binding protein (TBP) (component of TFIID and TFIIIB)